MSVPPSLTSSDGPFCRADHRNATGTRPFASLRASRTALLTTFRANKEGVSTPVSIALWGDRAYFITAGDSGKARRLAREPSVTLTACTTTGEVLGETVRGRARRVGPEERRRLRRLLRPTGSLFWTLVLYRLRGKAMNLYEVVPVENDDEPQT